MLEILPQLVILFLVIFDPLASFLVFVTASSGMSRKERQTLATLAIMVALGISLLFLLLGQNLLKLLNTSIEEFRIAGGIILGILGIKMALGTPLTKIHEFKGNSGRAIAAIIGTPLLTGPAAITAIMISVHDYGMLVTGLAVVIVLALTAVIFYLEGYVCRFLGDTSVQVVSTILGLVTLSWGVQFILTGILTLLA